MAKQSTTPTESLGQLTQEAGMLAAGDESNCVVVAGKRASREIDGGVFPIQANEQEGESC